MTAPASTRKSSNMSQTQYSMPKHRQTPDQAYFNALAPMMVAA
jgi:hypothetical protein